MSGHRAIVTGAAGGIGECFAMELARLGNPLLLIDLSEDRLAQTRERIRDAFPAAEVHALALDLTRPDVAEVLEAWCAQNGFEPDVLVNNAGIFSFRPIEDTANAKINTFIDLHVRAVMLLSQWFVRRRVPRGSGWLLNMSSMSCWMPMPGLAMYASTKACIRVFSRSLHYEVRDAGVHVMAACPGGIATDLFGLPPRLRRLAVRLGVLATPTGFAAGAVRRMFRGKAQYVNGLLNRISIVAVGMTPRWVRMQVKRRMLDRGILR